MVKESLLIYCCDDMGTAIREGSLDAKDVVRIRYANGAVKFGTVHTLALSTGKFVASVGALKAGPTIEVEKARHAIPFSEVESVEVLCKDDILAHLAALTPPAAAQPPAPAAP